MLNIPKKKEAIFELVLIFWFTISCYFCLQDKGSTFFILWEEVLNVTDIYIIYITMTRKDNGTVPYVALNSLMVIWLGFYALQNDSSASDLSLWRQCLYVASDVAMLIYCIGNGICSGILYREKALNKGKVDDDALDRLAWMYAGH